MSDFEDGGFVVVLSMFAVVLLQDGVESYGNPGGLDDEWSDGLIGPGGDAVYDLFFPRGMDIGNNADKGGKLFEGIESSDVADFGDDVGGGEGSDAGYRSEEGVVLLMMSSAVGFDAFGEGFDLLVNEVVLFEHAPEGQLNGGVVPLQILEPL